MNLKLITRYMKMFFSYGLGYPLAAPDSVSIIVTKRCNLRCVMCDFWKDTKKSPAGEMSLGEFKELFKSLRSLGTRAVQLTGGEPFLRKDLNDILREAKQNSLETAVVTNATLCSEDNVREFAANTDLVYISLDAPSKELHEKIRGVPNIFDKIRRSLQLLTDTIKANSFSTRVIICTIITPQGIHDPSKMVNLAKKLNVNGIIYNPPSGITYGYTTLKNAFDGSPEAHSAYSRMIDKIITLMSNPDNLIRSNPFYLEESKKFLKGDTRYHKFPCLGGGYNGPLVAFDGTVFPCCAWDKSMGNIKKSPFSKIWNSEAAREIRSQVKKRQCPVCHHHTRTFDFALCGPSIFRDFKPLREGYKQLFRL